jgi:hypothetical protein
VAALEKACAAEATLDAAGLARALSLPASGASRPSGAPAEVVVLDPALRTLELGGARLAVVGER